MMAVRASAAAAFGLVACLLAGAALGVSMAHAGPRGPQGPAGPRGPQGPTAQFRAQRLGVCWSSSDFTQDWADGTSDTWVSSVSLDQPQLANGVYQCPQGETFVPVVPQAGR